MIRTFQHQIGKQDILFILIIFLCALFLRFLYFSDYTHTKIYPVLKYSDGDYYYEWARDIESGDILGNKVFMKWPLYAYFLSLLLKISGNSVSAVYAFQFMLGAINCVLLYFIAKALFNRKVAFIAAMLCASYALFAFYDGLLTYTTLSLFLNSLLFLWLLHIQNHPGIRNLFLTGIFLGICTLAKANIAVFGVLAALWILRQNKLPLAKAAYVFSCFVAGLAVIIGIVFLRNYLAARDFVLISGNMGITFYSGNNPDSDGTFRPPFFMPRYLYGMNRDARIIAKGALNREPKTSEVSGFWFKKSLNFIKSNPRAYSKLLYRKFIYALGPREFILEPEHDLITDKIRIFKIMLLDLRFIFPFVFLGMLLNIKRFKDTALLYIIVFTLSFSIVLFFVASRYRIAMVPFLMIFASSGVIIFWEAVKKKSFLRLALFTAAIVLTFVLARPKERFVEFRYYIARANNYTINSDYPNALRFAKLAYAAEPNNPEVTFSLASAYYDMKEFKAAEGKFKEIIRISPICVDAYYNLGLLYMEQKRFKEAVPILEKATALDPEDISAHFELGRAYKAGGRKELARDEFNLALKKMNRWRTEEREIIKGELSSLGYE